jgi:hypothetical protein
MRRAGPAGAAVAVLTAAIVAAGLGTSGAAPVARPAAHTELRTIIRPPHARALDGLSSAGAGVLGSPCYVSLTGCSETPCVELIGGASPAVTAIAVVAVQLAPTAVPAPRTPKPTAGCPERSTGPRAGRSAGGGGSAQLRSGVITKAPHASSLSGSLNAATGALWHLLAAKPALAGK